MSTTIKRELILHIGLPKTGSTSIQAFVTQNRSRLLRHGIDYLTSPKFAKGNGQHFAQSLLPSVDPMRLPPTDALVAAFHDAIKNCTSERVLVSSELFTFASAEGWSELRDICDRRGRSLRLIAVVRNHADAISSSLIELVKTFGLTDLSREHIRLFYTHHPALKYNAYFSALRRLADRIQIISYDRAFAGGSLMADFLNALGGTCADGTWKASMWLNVTPSPEAVGFIRLCNSRNLSATVSNAIARWYPAHKAWTLISPTCAREIQDFFALEIEGFRSTFALSDDFFAEPRTNYVDLDAVSFENTRLLLSIARVVAGKKPIPPLRKSSATTKRATTNMSL
jgi:hypothetical protein